jgi:hypothetical protein
LASRIAKESNTVSKEHDLGKLICEENPYTQDMDMYPGQPTPHNINQIQKEVEYYDPAKLWDSAPLTISKMVRITYTYREGNSDKTDYLIVLYEGSGGGEFRPNPYPL